MQDYRWSHNPHTYRRTVTPNGYRTHTAPKFGLWSSRITGACQTTKFVYSEEDHLGVNIIIITKNSTKQMLKLCLPKLVLQVAKIQAINKYYPEETCICVLKNGLLSSFHSFQRRAQNAVTNLR